METGIIQVKRLEENEDGSANLEIVTDVEATRLLVEVGLTRLLEMAIDKENEEYELKHTTQEDVAKIIEGSVQQEMGEGSQATCEDNRTGTGD
jgi:RNase P/RNase MRP subunit POP5